MYHFFINCWLWVDRKIVSDFNLQNTHIFLVSFSCNRKEWIYKYYGKVNHGIKFITKKMCWYFWTLSFQHIDTNRVTIHHASLIWNHANWKCTWTKCWKQMILRKTWLCNKMWEYRHKIMQISCFIHGIQIAFIIKII